MGFLHARACQASRDFVLVGIVEPDPLRRRFLEQELHVQTFPSWRDLDGLPPPCGAIVATPDVHHESSARECLDRGLHTLLEKPLTRHSRRAAQLLEEFQRRHLVLADGLVEFFNPAWRTFEKHVPPADRIRKLTVRRFGRIPLRRESGPLLDLAIHDLSLIGATWGKGAWRSLGPNQLHREHPFSMHVSAGWGDSPPERSWILESEDGLLELDFSARRLRVRREGGVPVEIPVPQFDPLSSEHIEFARRIRTLSISPPPGLRAHLETLETLETIRERS